LRVAPAAASRFMERSPGESVRPQYRRWGGGCQTGGLGGCWAGGGTAVLDLMGLGSEG